MGKGKDKRAAEAPPERIKVPLFTAEWGREHLREHHGIKTKASTPSSLLAAIHQADHVAAGLGGRPIVVAHYHTSSAKRKDTDQ